MTYRVTQVCLAGAITHDFSADQAGAAQDLFHRYKEDERTLFAVLISGGKVIEQFPVEKRRKAADLQFGPQSVISDPHIAAAIDRMEPIDSRREDGVTWIDIRDAGRMAGIAVIAEREHNHAYA